MFETFQTFFEAYLHRHHVLWTLFYNEPFSEENNLYSAPDNVRI